jgi:assimilatory nitrate reductase catalytic subunit
MGDKQNSSIATTCPYCGVGCGLIVQRDSAGQVTLGGDPHHPANFGRLCSKGAALPETLGVEGRLLFPEIQGRRVSWSTALKAVADGFSKTLRAHGPNSVAFYVSGQLLTEDYYVANKLMKGFIGSANIDTNSRLCMASAVAGHKRAFGSDTVPCSYSDLERADLIVLVGSNTAWCHPVIFQRLRETQKRRRTKIVVIDPRTTPTCELADLHLALKPGSDAMLFNGLLNYLRREDALDWEFLEQHTEGFAAAMRTAKSSSESIPAVAAACQLPPDAVGQFFRLFARISHTVTLFSQGVNQSSSGTDKVNSIINCHLATGRIGKPGCGPFSLTGQPNAMGGREVGGLANTLAAHMGFEPDSVDRVSRFWRTRNVADKPGLKAVDLFKALGQGRIKAIWIMATNPMVSLPDADAMRVALERCPLVVVSDCMRHTDTTALADILLPAATWGEKDGTVTNSERRISRQRAFLLPPAEAQPDWWIITQVARQMGFSDAFAYRCAADIFQEHARLSAFENEGSRAFDLGALARISPHTYAGLAPVQWPLATPKNARPRHVYDGGKFYTPSGKARFIAVAPRSPAHPPSEDFPLILNTGRVRDQWHTMTRTGKSPRLSSHTPEPQVVMHPEDARIYHLHEAMLVQIRSRWGMVIGRVHTSSHQPRGSIFMPIHWNSQYASRARIDAVVNPVADPVSGEPEFKHTPVAVAVYRPRWYGFVLTREPVDFSEVDYWTRANGEQFRRYELAGEAAIANWAHWSRLKLGHGGDWLEFEDRGTGRYRGARIVHGRLHACIFVSPSHELPARNWLMALFDKVRLEESDRMDLLAGRAADQRLDAGPVVCACHKVGRNTLVEAIASQGLTTVEQIGILCQAGTHCGSCLPELRELLTTPRPLDVATS